MLPPHLQALPRTAGTDPLRARAYAMARWARQSRHAIATTVLIVAALANFRLLRVCLPHNTASAVPAYLERFAPVRSSLAAGTRVQYISNLSHVTENRADFVLARYSLVPVRIVPEHETRLVLVNSAEPLGGIDDSPGQYKLLQDYGNGLRLFERKSAAQTQTAPPHAAQQTPEHL